ncbi:MAG TPA: hypothetical protein VM937_07390 [Burkholderiaceae bacterium]|nr:hypothetical protein [Burkholderiaceae bacterium]
MMNIRVWLIACVCLTPVTPLHAQGGIWVNPKEFKAAVPDAERLSQPVAPGQPLQTTADKTPVFAIASAIGGQLNYIVAKQHVGSNLDPYERTTLSVPDYSLDAIVMRGIDRVVAHRFPDTDRVFMRLNPSQLDGVAPPDRERVAFARLTAELQQMPERAGWDRIVVVTPHYRGFERAGLGSKMHGLGMFVQGLNEDSTASEGRYEVIEPDGTPGRMRKNNYIALYYYAKLFILDAKTLQVLEESPWLIDEKIHNTSSDAINIAKSLTIEQLSSRLEAFAEKASGEALNKTLRGTIVPGEIKPVAPR